ncbi:MULTISPECIES: hypothetical protein [Novosphingobium]|uniref:hypothetical protein n=1 Tax=Novosphingobium TaxID=165696 RepID=UPI001CD5AE8A|nr:hypothetical protein [Novosphingobium percolationis]MCH7627495.1 hypothetical protein [Pseudomonadota bacterium]
MPPRPMILSFALAAASVIPGAAHAQAIGQSGGGLASISAADFHPAGPGDSIAPPTLQNPGSAFGMPDTSVRLSAGSSRAVIQTSEGRQVTYVYSTLTASLTGTESAAATLRASNVPATAVGSNAVTVSFQPN